MLNLTYNIIYQYKSSERKHLKKLRLKYGRWYQKTYGVSRKRVWYDGELKTRSIKHNIVKNLLLGSRFRCSYCSKRLVRSSKPIDHFVPNSSNPILSFHELNLVPSCDYCNSTLKKKFDPLIQNNRKYRFNNFFILHPIIDDIDNNIFYTDADRTILDIDRCTLKGLNSIDLFELYTEEMLDERINQFIINRDNPLNDEKLIRLVNQCATYQV